MDKDSLEIISATAEGATKGTLNFAKDEISKGVEFSKEKFDEMINKFKNKDFAFIEDKESINEARNQRKSAEFGQFKEYIQDKDLKILFTMGLTLRKLESNKKGLTPLKEKIIKKYDYEGLHICYFIQNGCFSKLIANLIGQGGLKQELINKVNDFFQNFKNQVIFITKYDNIELKSQEITTKIFAHKPDIFIISASEKEAMTKCQEIKNLIKPKLLQEYSFESYNSEQEREIYFLNLKNKI